MVPSRGFVALAFSLLLAGSMMYTDPVPYADGPPPGHTGGFGEPTCIQCHADQPDGHPRLVIAIAGLPEGHVGGRVYHLTMIVAHPEMKAAGFQFSARYDSGDRAGRQAGQIASPRHENQFRPVRAITDSIGVVYVSHALPVEGDSVVWSVRWTAPESEDPVVFHLAANASNFDDSEFGDRVGSAAFRSFPQQPRVGDGGEGRLQQGGEG